LVINFITVQLSLCQNTRSTNHTNNEDTRTRSLGFHILRRVH